MRTIVIDLQQLRIEDKPTNVCECISPSHSATRYKRWRQNVKTYSRVAQNLKHLLLRKSLTCI